MRITTSRFISSVTSEAACPRESLPEFAFIGRSNVGKSSLINMVTGRKDLAHISVKPGKTQTINHYLIDETWFLVDLPGYGYAKVSKTIRQGFGKIIEDYLLKRTSLTCLLVLLDCRLEPQPIDLDFITWAGGKGIPIALVFTKADKLTRNELGRSLQRYQSTLLRSWEELPPIIISSATSGAGKDDLLDFIGKYLPGTRR